MSLFRTKSIDELIAASEDPSAKLRRSLGLWSLIALGIGSVIGSGIFTLTGTAAAGLQFDYPSVLKAPVLNLILQGRHAVGTFGRPGAGPAISVSFILVAIACGFAALCYAELASMIPVSGSAYTYAYATLGEIFAWIIGWDLILEYAVANMAVAVGFAAYLNDLLDNAFGFHFPAAISNPVYVEGKATGAIFNIPAFILLMALSWILVRGARESTGANNAMVLIKVGAILLFIFGAWRAVNTANWHPFMPHGFSGVLTGAAIVFFTYIGFDAVSTAAEECRDPQRDMPLGILLTLVVCAVLYASVALVLTGIAHWNTLNNDAPVANALKALGFNRIRFVVTVGALLGMTSSLLVGQFGQARIWFAMSRDRLLPGLFSHVHPRFKTPHLSTWVAGFAVGIPAGIWDIGTFGDLTNIGTLFAFIVVSAGVIVLRRTQPGRPRAFRVPLVPLLPCISIGCCLVLMLGLPLETWIRFFVWLGIGLMIFFGYSFKFENSLPPALPWTTVVLLGVLTLGLFGAFWILYQSNFVRHIEGRDRSGRWLSGSIVLALAGLLGFGMGGSWIVLGWVTVPLAAVSGVVGAFKIRESLLRHYGAELPALSGVMTFLFHTYYFQYHLDRIASLRRGIHKDVP